MTGTRRWPVIVLLVWAVGAAAWNLEGVRRLAGGGQALGPTASLVGAVFIGVLALVLMIGERRSRMLALGAAAIMGLAGGLAIWGAVTGTADQWPSPGWRIGGALLNALALLGAAGMFGTRFVQVAR